ncbi:MAG: extracellular solute-binding protein [Ruminococcaceae bacterium]|nr:extracellular solute-binding protein [Oscillospiraceae bacterium]
MNVRIKKILSFLLAALMLFGVLSTSVFVYAAEDDSSQTEEATVDPLASLYTYDAVQLEKLIGVDSYNDYTDKHADAERASKDSSFFITPDDLVTEDAPVSADGKTVYTADEAEDLIAEQEAEEEEQNAEANDGNVDEEELTGGDASEEAKAEEEEEEQKAEIIYTTAEHSIIDASEIKDTKGVSADYFHYDEAVEGDVLVTGDTGETVFRFQVPETGKYAMRVTYTSNPQADADAEQADAEISTTIERMLYIDGKLPFSEARYLYFPRCWTYEYQTLEEGKTLKEMGYDTERYEVDEETGRIIDKKYDCYTFPEDKNGNDTRPRRWEVLMWQTYYVRDWLGYDIDPFEFYLEEGWHTLTLVSNREHMIISNIEFYAYEEEPEYDEWLKEMKKNGVKEVKDHEPIKVQAENPEFVSVQNVFPGNDRTSSITEPQDPAVIKYNILDNGGNNNWMKYKVEVKETGLYSMSFRFRQNSLIGMFSSRRVKINGEVQFREANHLRFMYDTEFQSTYANNGEQEFLFYLEEGENTVEIEIVLGEMEKYVYQIEQMIDELNDVYQRMLMITGPVPDSYRDYGFRRLVPDCIVSIGEAANELYQIQEDIVEMTGADGDQTNTLLTIADLFKEMTLDEYTIAPNFLTFKNYIIALSDWLYAALGQPLKLDYFVIGDVNEELPQDVSTSWQKVWFECSAFVASFTMDYTTIGFSDDGMTEQAQSIEMWAVADRESMLITRYIVDNYFSAEGCPGEGISLRIRVITAGLQEAILAGIGPDISFLDTVNTITFGMRTAIEPIQNMEGFEEIMSEYSYAAVEEGKQVPLAENPWYKKVSMTALNEKTGKEEYNTYGLPTNLLMPMAFYRVDVLHELGIGMSESWDDLLSSMPALLNNNFDIGLSTALPGAQLFIYQQDGGDLFRDNGYRTNLDSTESLSAFKTLCEMFQKYSAPVAYDITRFRTGEIPIMVSEDGITIYNTLMTYYELRGLWQLAPAIGTVREDGTVNHTAVANTLAMIMPKDRKRTDEEKEAIWTYMKWYCGADSQMRQARETIATSLPTTKYSTANVKALLAQKWTDEERAAVRGILSSLETVPEYPGSYILTQYVSFAFLNAYNKGENPADAMLEQVTYINKEIARKREEFGLDFWPVTYEEDAK